MNEITRTGRRVVMSARRVLGGHASPYPQRVILVTVSTQHAPQKEDAPPSREGGASVVLGAAHGPHHGEGADSVMVFLEPRFQGDIDSLELVKNEPCDSTHFDVG